MLVSHNHSDHNADLRAVDDLCYELYNRADHDKKKESKYVLILDKQTDALVEGWRTDGEHPEHIAKTVVLELNDYNPDRMPDDVHTPALVKDLTDLGLPFKIHYFKAQHTRDVYAAVGFTVECLPEDEKRKSTFISFSCDTRFFKRLCEQDHLGAGGILVAHISQPEDVELLIPSAVKTGFHLGYRGTENLIKGCEPKLTLLGEFWGGLADQRLEIALGLQAACNRKNILPTSAGLLVNPVTCEIQCQTCRRWMLRSEIRVNWVLSYGPLSYVCKSHSV